MNTRPPLEDSSSTVALSVQFNHDCKMFAVGLNSGFCIFNTETCVLLKTRDFNAGIGLAQMLGSTNLVGLVGGGRNPKFANNKLVLWDEMKSKPALEISALTPIRGVQLSKERIVVALDYSVRVYKFAKTPDFLFAYDTAYNPHGLCCMSSRQIAFPGRTTGQVLLVEIATSSVIIIPAHSSAVRAIRFSPDGSLLATASETGTLIRVFSTTNGARLVELRRGIDTATIFSLAFSPSGTQLACTSDKSTLHIFDVSHPNSSPTSQPRQASVSPTSPQFPPQSSGIASEPSSDNGISSSTSGSTNEGRGKWGILSKIPLMPRMFSDVYSFTSTSFEAGDPVGGSQMSPSTTLGPTRPPKGMVAWLEEDTLVVVGGGLDARWEKFVVVRQPAGTASGQQYGGLVQDGCPVEATKRVCVRRGWKRYLASP